MGFPCLVCELPGGARRWSWLGSSFRGNGISGADPDPARSRFRPLILDLVQVLPATVSIRWMSGGGGTEVQSSFCGTVESRWDGWGRWTWEGITREASNAAGSYGGREAGKRLLHCAAALRVVRIREDVESVESVENVENVESSEGSTGRGTG